MKSRIIVLGCCSIIGCGAQTDRGGDDGDTSGIMASADGSADAGDGDGDSGDGDSGDGDGDSGDGDGDSGDGDGDSGDSGGFKFDLSGVPDGNSGNGCQVPLHNPCDDEDDDPWHALGINCGNEIQFTTQYTGEAVQLYVHTGQLGTYDPPTYPVLEGEKMVILSSGTASEMTTTGDKFASTSVGAYMENILPAPLNMNGVDLVDDCIDNPNLVGTGDCSNTLQQQWDQGSGAYDYAELRLSGTVPAGASGFEYHLAFFSTEYPNYYQSSFNDMYVAWLESELWTGNVSFDEMGNPISLNAGFLDYKDAPNNNDCPAPCMAPELQGTVMESHAGTKWLTTTAGVVPGEDVTIIWAIWDLSDEVLDSVVILDDFSWNCEGGPPQTIPG